MKRKRPRHSGTCRQVNERRSQNRLPEMAVHHGFPDQGAWSGNTASIRRLMTETDNVPLHPELTHFSSELSWSDGLLDLQIDSKQKNAPDSPMTIRGTLCLQLKCDSYSSIAFQQFFLARPAGRCRSSGHQPRRQPSPSVRSPFLSN